MPSQADPSVALLTAGKDRHYVAGLLNALMGRGVRVECVAGNELLGSQAVVAPHVVFRNFVGDQSAERTFVSKMRGLVTYYGRLCAFVLRTDARIVHILWFRRFPLVEGALLGTFLKLTGKKVVFTAHNVDGYARDGVATSVSDLGLRYLYHLVDHILVHTTRMKNELVKRFGIERAKVTIVPLGINDVIPVSSLSRTAAKQRFGFAAEHRTLLFFGTIVKYKGIEHLVKAFSLLRREDPALRLIIAGPVWREGEAYWQELRALIQSLQLTSLVRAEVTSSYIADETVATFFRAADVSVLPYDNICQSGVLTLSYRQGVPVIAADVGSMPEDVVPGVTGFVFKAADPNDLAATITEYFVSDLYRRLNAHAAAIRAFGEHHFSWSTNAVRTCAVYESLLGISRQTPAERCV